MKTMRNMKMPYLVRAYNAWLWEPYDPITDEDFMNLPDLYEIAFEDKTTDAPELPILHVRTYSRHKEGDEWVTDDKEVYDGVFINLINVNAEDSEIMRLLAEAGALN